jgi:hypothetical protein
LVHGDVDHFYENTGRTEIQVNKTNGKKIPQGNIFKEILKPEPLFIKTATTFFRKEIMVKYFDYDLAIKKNWLITDLPLWMDIAYNSKVHYFDEVLATYRLLNESVSRIASPQKKLNYHMSIYSIQKHYLEKYNCDKALKMILEEDHNRGLIRVAYRLGNNEIIENSIRFLMENKCKVTLREQIMLYTVKTNIWRRLTNLVLRSRSITS